ncbi:D-sedoheptulose-7-phosphate isomerase [Deminuibacter soli]|uniref:Phosphoheptose isomerase n=1 Tax=Deminuibacter soli TaxID=2291815 RepID=A0A3E1NCM7_9BACT|nr:D-sedoheptulose 7-phosphate isomerase [Deminuibacter soli]RFM25612.1 SIS domain-containing protein [Deminuibacter soli]
MDKIRNIISASVSVKQQLLQDDLFLQQIAIACNTITNAFKNGNKVLFCGNGGSAADAQHLAAEFSGRFYKNRQALPAEALHCNTSYLTAVANDYSFDEIYARLVTGIGLSGDVLIGLSTSGNSPNIVRAFEAAREKGVITMGFTGITGGALKAWSDYLFNVPATDTPRIQEAHILIGHIICQLVEEQLFGGEDTV